MSTINQKLIYSAIGAGLMILLANPFSSKLTNKIVGNDANCPSVGSHLLTSLLFLLLIFVIMLIPNMVGSSENKKSIWLLLKYSFYATLLFFVITNSEIYKLTSKFGGITADSNGCPSIIGLIVHAFVFFLLTFVVMFFPTDTCNC